MRVTARDCITLPNLSIKPTLFPFPLVEEQMQELLRMHYGQIAFSSDDSHFS